MTIHENENSQTFDFNFGDGYVPLSLYSFFDKKLNKYLPPFFAQNLDDAKRQATNIVNFSNSLICKFPNDYDLVFIGYFDENLGSLISSDIQNRICCSDFKTSQSLQYDDLLKESKRQQDVISNLLKTVDDYKYKLDEKLTQNYKIESDYSSVKDDLVELKKSVELFVPVQPLKPTKKSIISTLFNK